ncbi:hypothetical protein ONZ45_g5253 [Pleurotus djamor]|nr:hypothetical protein ONZ45_g5253 [Pleurotus djamor]
MLEIEPTPDDSLPEASRPTPYQITARVYQADPSAWFQIVERTVWNYANGGTWTDVGGKQVLTMGGSGTSGILRFNDKNEYFTVALGVHNYKHWVDVTTGLTSNSTATVLHKDYYTSGKRASVREKQLGEFKVASGRNIEVKYDSIDGTNLECSIFIGA